MTKNKVNRRDARGYALDCSLEALIDDLEHHDEVYPHGSIERVDAVALLHGMIRACNRQGRRYWRKEISLRLGQEVV